MGMLKVTDQQFNQYAGRLKMKMFTASAKELELMVPSIVHLQKQANDDSRQWQCACILQDFQHYRKIRG